MAGVPNKRQPGDSPWKTKHRWFKNTVNENILDSLLELDTIGLEGGILSRKVELLNALWILERISNLGGLGLIGCNNNCNCLSVITPEFLNIFNISAAFTDVWENKELIFL